MNVIRRFSLALLVLMLPLAHAQTAPSEADSGLPDYPGVRTYVPGVFVPAVPNSPFSATVDIVSHERMPDGVDHIRTTFSRIARSSSGRIYNERRLLVPATYAGTPPLLSSLIYDPANRLSILLLPHQHLAREHTITHPAVQPNFHLNPNPGPGRTEESLGTQTAQGFTLQGIRKTRTVSANLSGTGQPITISDEYWYSADLDLILVTRHNDPRTGEQIVTVKNIVRAEPDASLLSVPADYKVVDETVPSATATPTH